MNKTLTDYLQTAQSGEKHAVEPLCKHLPDGNLYVPFETEKKKENDVLAPDTIEEFRDMSSSDISSIRPLILENEQSKPFLILLTSRELPEKLSSMLGSKNPEAQNLSGDTVIELATNMINDGEIEGVVFDPFQETELRLHASEFKSLADGEPVPLKYHLRGKNLAEDQIQRAEAPKTEIPEEFLEIIDAYVSSDPKLNGYEYMWGTNPEVDSRPHIILNIVTGGQDIDEKERTRELHQAVVDCVPPPGFFEVVFDRSLKNIQ